MLLWLIDAAGVDAELVAEARQASADATSMQQASGQIRGLVSWDCVAEALSGDRRRPGPIVHLVDAIRSLW